jgi:pimeloyl-ACP methyl ester carboxylesterase
MPKRFVDAARIAGDNAEYVELANAGHMAFLDPKSEAHAILCAWLTKVATTL